MILIKNEQNIKREKKVDVNVGRDMSQTKKQWENYKVTFEHVKMKKLSMSIRNQSV